jgi:hypothetical protein
VEATPNPRRIIPPPPIRLLTMASHPLRLLPAASGVLLLAAKVRPAPQPRRRARRRKLPLRTARLRNRKLAQVRRRPKCSPWRLVGSLGLMVRNPPPAPRLRPRAEHSRRTPGPPEEEIKTTCLRPTPQPSEEADQDREECKGLPDPPQDLVGVECPRDSPVQVLEALERQVDLLRLLDNLVLRREE